MTPEKQDKTLELSKHWSVDHVTPAVINVEENSQVMDSVQPLQNLQPVIQPRRSQRIRKTPVWHEDYEIS